MPVPVWLSQVKKRCRDLGHGRSTRVEMQYKVKYEATSDKGGRWKSKSWRYLMLVLVPVPMLVLVLVLAAQAQSKAGAS